MKKKFLSLFTLLIAIVISVALVACEDYGDKNDGDETTTKRTYTHTAKNGTFYDASTTSTATSGDMAILDKVTDWTQMSGSTTTSKTGSEGVLSAVIDISDADTYNAIADKYLKVYEDASGTELENSFTMPNPGIDPKTPMVNVLDENGKIVTENGNPKKQKEDTNVFVLANTKKEGSLYVTSSSFTLEQDSRYLLQFSVCSKVDAASDDTTKGAWFVLGGDMEYTVKCINTNGQWKTYYLFIETNKYTSMSIKAELWLGYGPGISTSTTNPDDKGMYSTRGVAFFDNVICEKVDDDKLDEAITDENIVSYGTYTYESEDEMNDNFAEFKSALNSTSDGRGNKYVTAKSAYFLTNANMELRKKPTSYNTTSYRKYFYSFRENYGTSNLSKYSMTSNATYDAKYYGSVDVSKLYDIVTDTSVDLSKVTDNYSKSTSEGGIGTSAKFYAMGYEAWRDSVMNDPNHNLNSLDETYVMMMFNRDLQANTIKTTETIKIEPNVYYEISVWAYVWAQMYGENYYPEFSDSEPVNPYSGEFTSFQKQVYDLLKTEGPAVMENYTESLTAEEKELAKGYEAALTAMGNYTYNGTSSDTLRTAAANWIRGLLGLSETTDVASTAEAFYYAYLKNNLSTLTSNVQALETHINVLYQYERQKNIETFKTLEKKVADYNDKHDDWAIDKADYESKYTIWQEQNRFPKATVKLTGAGESDNLEQKTSAVGEWQKLTFYVLGNQLSQRQLTVEMSLGTGSDDTTFMIGGVFFDNIKVKAYKTNPDAGKEWKRLAEIESEGNVAFGGLTGNGELTETTAEQIANENWNVSTAEGTAAADKDQVSVKVTEGDIGTIKVAGADKYLYVLEYNNEKATASTLTYKGGAAVQILPNRFYRFAFLVRTEDVDETLGIKINLLTGTDGNNLDTTKDSTVTKYVNNSDEWAEVVYYICGDLIETYYVGISVEMGSGTRFVTDSYVSGKVYLAAFNALEIDYDEYNTAATGDKIVKGVSLYNISAEIDSNSTTFTNSYYSKLDYSKTEKEEFDGDGKLSGIGTTSSWTVSSVIDNDYDLPTSLSLNLSPNPKTLTWKGSDGVTTDADGVVETGVPTHYEIWMKYADEDGNLKEKLYDKVTATGDNTDYTYSFTEDWSNTKLTYFAVKAIGNDGVSSLTSYTSSAMGSGTGTAIPTPKTSEDPTEARAGTVSVSSEGLFSGAVDGVNYVSPYKTVMKLTSNYKSVISVYSQTLSSGLSADGYYKISVWVKTDVGTYASITIGGTSGALQAATDDSRLGFVHVTTDGEWQEYCVYVKTGNFNAKMFVKYSLGNPYAKAKTGSIGSGDKVKYYATTDFSKGTAYFDAVRVTSVTEDEYNAAKDLDENYSGPNYASALHETIYTTIPYYIYCMEYVLDSFDASTEPTSTSTDNDVTGNTPSNYNRNYDTDLTKDGTLASYGVYNYESANTNETMKTAIEQLYKYRDTKEDEEKFVYNKIFSELFGAKFDCGEWGKDEWNTFMGSFLSVDRKDANGNVIYEGGSNVLVMSNKAESGYAQHYSLDSTYNYKAKAGTYTKITFSARTLIARVEETETTDSNGNTKKDYQYFLDNAFGEFRVTPSSSKDDTVRVKINSYVYGAEGGDVYQDVTYTVYLYNPTDSDNTVNWAFYLGDEKDDDEKEESWLDWYLVGLMAIDLVSAESITEAEYEAGKNAANGTNTTVYAYEYSDTTKTPAEDPEEPEEPEEEESFWDKLFKNEYFWLYISSFVIGLVIIVTVIAVLVKRWKKKHPKEVVVENVAKTEKDIKVVPSAPQVKEDALEADEYVDEIKPVYNQRVNKNKSRKDRKKGKK